MREIKFRGKRIDNGEWVVGDYSRYSKDHSIIMVDLLEQEDYWVWSATVGQFTGLKDKNGKEIFEGDVLIFDGDRFVILWDDERCGFRMDYWMFNEQYDLSELWPTSEVIGDIHDNPELMEVRE